MLSKCIIFQQNKYVDNLSYLHFPTKKTIIRYKLTHLKHTKRVGFSIPQIFTCQTKVLKLLQNVEIGNAEILRVSRCQVEQISVISSSLKIEKFYQLVE